MFNTIRKCIRWWAILTMALLLGACGKSEQSAYQPTSNPSNPNGSQALAEYRLAIVPEGSQMRVPEVYGPLVDYLNARIEGVKLVLIAPRNHAELDGALRNGNYEFALVNALQVIQSNEHHYHVVSKKGDDSQFYGIFLVRRDSGIHYVSDLKGKKVSYPSPTGVAATILPKQFLKSHGLDVSRDIENLYVGSHEASILHVYSGKTAAGTAREFAWQAFQKTHPKEAADLELKWKTAPLIDQAIVARNDIPKALTDHIGQLLASMHDTAEGRAVLSKMSSSKFEPADDATYDQARKFFSENADLLEVNKSSTTGSLQKGTTP